MQCACGRTIAPDPPEVDAVWSATSYARCIYRCQCGRGYSNAAIAANRTCITDRPVRNVPDQVAEGLNDVLGAALNVRNRPTKRDKFCFETSEDAVTWTIFRWLTASDGLAIVPAAAGLPRPNGPPTLLLWGVPPADGPGGQFRDALADVCDELGEDPNRRSEPDVVIAWPELLVFIEVKYQAPNDVKRGYANFVRYTDRAELYAVSPATVAATGYYELVRNWRIGVAMAERLERSFALINLGPRRLASRTPGVEGVFKTASSRVFVSLTWADFLAAVEGQIELPPWLAAFVAVRQLDSRWA